MTSRTPTIPPIISAPWTTNRPAGNETLPRECLGSFIAQFGMTNSQDFSSASDSLRAFVEDDKWMRLGTHSKPFGTEHFQLRHKDATTGTSWALSLRGYDQSDDQSQDKSVQLEEDQVYNICLFLSQAGATYDAETAAYIKEWEEDVLETAAPSRARNDGNTEKTTKARSLIRSLLETIRRGKRSLPSST